MVLLSKNCYISRTVLFFFDFFLFFIVTLSNGHHYKSKNYKHYIFHINDETLCVRSKLRSLKKTTLFFKKPVRKTIRNYSLEIENIINYSTLIDL